MTDCGFCVQVNQFEADWHCRMQNGKILSNPILAEFFDKRQWHMVSNWGVFLNDITQVGGSLWFCDSMYED